MGKLVQLTICNSEVERTALLPFLKAYGINATPPDQHAHNVSYSPAHLGGFPIYVVDSDLNDARALLVTLAASNLDRSEPGPRV